LDINSQLVKNQARIDLIKIINKVKKRLINEKAISRDGKVFDEDSAKIEVEVCIAGFDEERDDNNDNKNNNLEVEGVEEDLAVN